jgi:hypothetical protein
VFGFICILSVANVVFINNVTKVRTSMYSGRDTSERINVKLEGWGADNGIK